MAKKARKNSNYITDRSLRYAVAERREELRRLIYAALFLALAFLLPFLTANNRALNTLISPMHIPAFLCGLICGPGWGAAIGFCAPLLRSVALGMPPIPMAACMAFELAVYGAVSGLLRRLLPKKVVWIYVSREDPGHGAGVPRLLRIPVRQHLAGDPHPSGHHPAHRLRRGALPEAQRMRSGKLPH